jgi:hypothetical protein
VETKQPSRPLRRLLKCSALSCCQEIAEGTRAPNARKEAEWGIIAKDPSLKVSTGTSIDEEGGSSFLSTSRRGKESFSSTNMKHLEAFLQKRLRGKREDLTRG